MKTKALFLFLFSSSMLFSRTITIGIGGDFPNLSSAESSIVAGDTVLILDGVYSDGSQFLENLNGSESQPILIIAESLHNAVFSQGTEAIHLINCSYLIIDGLQITQQTGNGINIDDGGDYNTPTHHITIRNCLFINMPVNGNHDFLKLSGLDDFLIDNCEFIDGASGGSGVDMVGCHRGIIQNCSFDNAGVSGIQAKGGTQYITIRRNEFANISQRAINIGGSTGLQFFRPPLPDDIIDAFESADILVHSNVFVGNWAPIAYVGTVNSRVINNTFYKPENWVFRILQETTVDGFLPCSNNTFQNNIIYLESDLTEVNTGPNTAAETFFINSNLWFNESSTNWTPNLPVVDERELIVDPQFVNHIDGDFTLMKGSPGIGYGISDPDVLIDFNADNFLDPPSVGAIESGILSSTSQDWLESAIVIYPNPSSEYLFIDSPLEIEVLEVYNSNGDLMMNRRNIDKHTKLNVSALSSGQYIIHLKEKQSEKVFSSLFSKF